MDESAKLKRIECMGGPHDGERVRDQGAFWRVVAVVDPETAESRPGSSGTYVERSGVYQWEPDP